MNSTLFFVSVLILFEYSLYSKIKNSVKGLDELRKTLNQQGKLTREM